jgi:hypothetical protein
MKYLKVRLLNIKTVHERIRAIAARPASNMKLMQVAGPFREVINQLKFAEQTIQQLIDELEAQELLK